MYYSFHTIFLQSYGIYIQQDAGTIFPEKNHDAKNGQVYTFNTKKRGTTVGLLQGSRLEFSDEGANVPGTGFKQEEAEPRHLYDFFIWRSKTCFIFEKNNRNNPVETVLIFRFATSREESIIFLD